jgi:CDP-paratose 2-epimerase
LSIAIVTGSGGLIGAEAVRRLSAEGMDVVGIDNDMRAEFFGADASTRWSVERLQREIPGYRHISADIRDEDAIRRCLSDLGRDIACVIHTAAQPSHDWAAKDPITDFDVNARGTLLLLQGVRDHCPDAAFVFTSTNKVYGDTPNRLPLVELDTRYELPEDHRYFAGVDESMSIDASMHSVFGASKVAADVLVQEYGRYFDLRTVCFRGGCLTGSGHSGAELHGFLAYLTKCALTGTPYRVIGYGGKQVRDNIHAADLVSMFWAYLQDPKPGAVYNAGGGRARSCSVLEATTTVENLTGRSMTLIPEDQARMGDHQWWISSVSNFQQDYPQWDFEYSLEAIFSELVEGMRGRVE